MQGDRRFDAFKARLLAGAALVACAPLATPAWAQTTPPAAAAPSDGLPPEAVYVDADNARREGDNIIQAQTVEGTGAATRLTGVAVYARDSQGGLAIVTSRCSLELIQKALRAGIQTLVSLSAPTGLAVQWARRHNLNLIHLPQKNAPRVYSPASENQA